ncbi:hypothetical protein DB42_CU00080 [Neochlamydia sp. EPS4]|nr:hypothetical protein DB42_CU00080 [Neochlamydia sp. EPS4]
MQKHSPPYFSLNLLQVSSKKADYPLIPLAYHPLRAFGFTIYTLLILNSKPFFNFFDPFY